MKQEIFQIHTNIQIQNLPIMKLKISVVLTLMVILMSFRMLEVVEEMRWQALFIIQMTL